EREFKLAAALRSEGQTASAIEHLHIALELNSNNAEAHLLLGFIQMERRDYAKAEKDLSTAIKLLESQHLRALPHRAGALRGRDRRPPAVRNR
ncbi:MAG: tetratricopeptide repeat protein, partial [Deltaproteobacteria bacterium]|nr:tetratricopeptide repeat protein [Deltaproteobacteria bacterium]